MRAKVKPNKIGQLRYGRGSQRLESTLGVSSQESVRWTAVLRAATITYACGSACGNICPANPNGELTSLHMVSRTSIVKAKGKEQQRVLLREAWLTAEGNMYRQIGVLS